VAERFELYWQGVELANGYRELTDSIEQAQRFEADNSRRRAQGLPQLPIDKNLLAALESGLPECAGVALGLDRLLMLKLGLDRIEDTLAFPWDHA
jgi:lysyl-tRNA synthetase class 2